MKWYEDAAESFINILEYYEVEEIQYWQETDVRFHFEAGMWVRNKLRALGFTDDKYGNLDDHYMKILEIVYKRSGL